MYEKLHRALIPARCKVAGRKLNGLTLWHLQLLEAVESPILGGSDMPIIPQDLLVLGEIVNCKYPQEPRFKNSPKTYLWGILLRHSRFLSRATSILKVWLDNELSFPELGKVISGDSRGSTSTAPPHMATAQAVSVGACTPIKDVWNMRLAEVRWLECVIAESNGAKFSFSYELSDEEKAKKPLTKEAALKLALETLPPHMAEKFKKAKDIKIYGVSD